MDWIALIISGVIVVMIVVVMLAVIIGKLDGIIEILKRMK